MMMESRPGPGKAIDVRGDARFMIFSSGAINGRGWE